MPPSISKVKLATAALLCEARKDGELQYVLAPLSHEYSPSDHHLWHRSDLTVRKVRQMLEDQLSLQPGTLEAKEFKTAIKDTVVAKLVGLSPNTLRTCYAATDSR